MSTTLSSFIKKIILKEKKKNPQLGVRKLKILLKKEYNLNISKSSIHNVLKKSNYSKVLKPSSLYLREKSKYSTIITLISIDSYINIYSNITEELKPYFPLLGEDTLKDIIKFLSFSSFIGGTLKNNLKNKEFLNALGIKYITHKDLNYFLERVDEYKPLISLENTIHNASRISTIKFYSSSGKVSFCDAKFFTFWDSLCNIEHFFNYLFPAKMLLEDMIRNKIFMCYYTKSFDYLSSLFFDFINCLSSGIKMIDFLDSSGKILERFELRNTKFSFFIGYYPKVLGYKLIEKPNFKRIFNLDKDIYYSCNLSKFRIKDNREVVLKNIILRQKTIRWGIITNIENDLEVIIKKYLTLWPFLDEGFIEDLKIIESYIFKNTDKNREKKLIPENLTFKIPYDFIKIIDILNSFLKENIGNLEAKVGVLIKCKDFYKLIIPNLSNSFKKSFNSFYFCYKNKRIFLM